MAYKSKYDGDTIQNAISSIVEGKLVKKVGGVAPSSDSGNVTISVADLDWVNEETGGVTPAQYLKNQINFDSSVNTLIEAKGYVTAATAPVRSVNNISPTGTTGNISIETGITKIKLSGTSYVKGSDGSVDLGTAISGIQLGTGSSIITSGTVTITPTAIGALDSSTTSVPLKPEQPSSTSEGHLPKMDGGIASIGSEPGSGESEHFARWDHVHEHDSSKVDVVTGYGLSKNDFTDALKTKLDDIEEGANKFIATTAAKGVLGYVQTTSSVSSTSGYVACPIISGVPYYNDLLLGIKINGDIYSRDSSNYINLPVATSTISGTVKLGSSASAAGGDGIAASQASLQSVNTTLTTVNNTVSNIVSGSTAAKKASTVSSSQNNSTKLYITGVTEADGSLYYNSNVFISTNNVLMGGAWNDYAESRDSIEDPSWLIGRCVKEVGNGQISVTTDYLDCCAGIVSDTYGMLIGADYESKCPIAVAGRVLVYPETEPEDFEIDDVVCAAPDGCVRKMTREEIREWPERIVGIVSEIPRYEKWNNIEVNGRIWIKVK